MTSYPQILKPAKSPSDLNRLRSRIYDAGGFQLGDLLCSDGKPYRGLDERFWNLRSFQVSVDVLQER